MGEPECAVLRAFAEAGAGTLATVFGALAGALHFLGFLLYTDRVRRGEIVPHGVSWSMRCYGALVHFLIFAEIGLPAAILIQPAVSGLCALAVTVFALSRGSWLRPTRTDLCILAADVGLLLVYLGLRRFPPDVGDTLLLGSVVAVTAIRKLVPYVPVLLTVRVRPEVERPGAWAVWALGYAALFAAAMLAGMPPVYTVYPAVVCCVHLVIWMLVMRRGGAPGRVGPWRVACARGPAFHPAARVRLPIATFPPYLS